MRTVVLLVTFGLMTGHGHAQGAEGSSSPVYRPNPAALAKMDAETARRALKELLADKDCNVVALFKGSGEQITQFDISEEAFHVIKTIGNHYRGPKTIAYADLMAIEVAERRRLFGTERYVHLLDEVSLMDTAKEECVRRLADALFVLRREARGEGSDDKFQAVAAAYRSADPKPSFPEEARRFRVQAETAVREKRFDDAARGYRDALQAAPWWPEGRFNRSLLLGELKRYDEAIREMKRYLALAPDAPNARAAQDKIYEWEGKVRSTR